MNQETRERRKHPQVPRDVFPKITERRSTTACQLMLCYILLLAVSCEGLGFFHGITETDDVGNIISVDPDDWRDDGIISDALFYPNPASYLGYLTFQLSTSADVELDIRGAWNETVLRRRIPAGREGSKAGVNMLSWDFRDEQGRRVKNGTCRVYIRTAKGGETSQTYGDVNYDPKQ